MNLDLHRRQLYRYKGDQCAHCGLQVQEMIKRYGTFNRMFELNHVEPDKKRPDYDKLIRRVISTEQLDELDKCILLCTQCHRIVHAQDVPAELEITVNIGLKKAVQRLKGQMIIDACERKAYFLTNERILVIPYRVKVGERRPCTMFGTDLEKGGFLINGLKKLEQLKSITVFAWNSKTVLMRAEHMYRDIVRIQHDLKFPIFTAELRASQETIWIRNGIALTKAGEVSHNGTVKYDVKIINT